MSILNIGGRDISLRRQGQGPLVVCLHSSSSHSGQFKPLIDALSDRYEVVAPDLHGYGRSAKLPQDGQPWYQHDVKIVEALLSENNDPVHLVGHSLGGAVACIAAMRSPDRIKSLTMIEPVLFMLLEQSGNPLISEGHFATAKVHGNLMLNRPEAAARDFVDFWPGEGTFERTPPHVREYVVATIDRVADDWAGMVPIPPEAPSLQDLSKLTMPVQLIRGGQSRPSARAIVDLLAERVPHALLTEVPEAAHMAAATHPELINPHVLSFIHANTD